MVAPVGKGLNQSSGRIIALGRLLLATLFMLAVLLDTSQPTHAPDVTYVILGGYILFALLVLALTWRDWWLDARLAGYAHGVDILLFTLLVLLTEGYTSPFFTFFMFILMAAALRWSWHVTALTAMLLTLLYLAAGLVVMKAGVPFEPQRFLVRTGHLVILSLILIWFGASRGARLESGESEPPGLPTLDESPLECALRSAMARVGATSGLFVWRQPHQDILSGIALQRDDVATVQMLAAPMADAVSSTPFIYDVARRRAIRRDAEGNLVRSDPAILFGTPPNASLPRGQGLAVPVQAEGGEGLLLLEGIGGLSLDHLDLGNLLARESASLLHRHALLHAAEESAEARSRLTLARDLHDSVVQFLAGAAFRLEAMKRSNASGRDVEADLNELKQLMMQEQRELRSFIASLRSGNLAAFNDLARDLQSLADRLARQWGIDCVFSSQPAEIMIPTRLRLDAHQLMREAVANAVRHAAARSVQVELKAIADSLCLEFINDGAEFRPRGGRVELPFSLKERVEQAGGMLDMSRGMGVTRLTVSLPLGEAGR